MTEIREFYAETVEEAVARAAKELGVSEENLSYKVLDPGSSGFMGIGARDARIEVRLDVPTAFEETGEEAPEEEPVLAEEQSYSDESPVERPAPEDLLQEVRAFMEGLLENMGLEDVRLDVYDAGEFIAVDVASKETGLFIGQKGETIDAIQYLVNVSVYKHREFVKRIVLDSEGYRQRRIEALQGMAHRFARRAVRERRSVELPPMNPSERRIVHLYLRDDKRVKTVSEGSGENRRVTISPV